MTGTSAPSPLITQQDAPALEALLGDPFAHGSITFADLIANEDASRLTPALRQLWHAGEIGAELVPLDLGGRRTSAAGLVRRLRPIFRRDPSLGVDLVVAPLAVMTAAMSAGDDAQRRAVAARVRSGARIGAVLTGSDPGSSAASIRLHRRGAGWIADGESSLVAGADAPDMWALPARIGDQTEALVLCETGDATPAPQIETVGLRGTRFAAATVRSLAVDRGHVLGAEDGSHALVRARIETAAIVAALAIATVDTAIRLAIPYASERRLYRGTVLEIPHARSLLADVHTDLLIADVVASQVVDGMDAGGLDELTASAGAYLVPLLLTDAMRGLSVLFGSTFYARVEPYAVFETLLRDVGSLSLVGVGTPGSLDPIAAALRAWGDGALAFDDRNAGEPATVAAEALFQRRARFGDRVRATDLADAAAARRLAREAAILIAAGACDRFGRTGPTVVAAEWRAAAHVRWHARLTGRAASLPESSIESAVDDLTSCVDDGISVTLERVPVFGRIP